MGNLLNRRYSRRGVAIAAGLALATTGMVSLAVADRANCSDVAAGSIVESAKYTEYDNQRGKSIDAPIADLPIGEASASAAVPSRANYAVQAIDGLARTFTVDASSGSVYSYFLDRDIAGLKPSEFLRLGGIELDQDPGEASFAAHVLKVLGDRAVEVRLGTFVAALTWGDPDANGTRTHNLLWFDGAYNYALIGDRSAANLVNLGRRLVCSP